VVLVDTGVLIGYIDAADAFHSVARPRLDELIDATEIATSAITFAEIRTGVHLGKHDPDSVENLFAGVFVLDADREIAEVAARLRGQRRSEKLRLPDALILAT